MFTLALACDLFPGGEGSSNRSGTALSIVFSLNSVGELIGPVFGGWLVTSFDIRMSFAAVGALSLVLLLAFMLLAFGCTRPAPFHYSPLSETRSDPPALQRTPSRSPMPSRPALGTALGGTVQPFSLGSPTQRNAAAASHTSTTQTNNPGVPGSGGTAAATQHTTAAQPVLDSAELGLDPSDIYDDSQPPTTADGSYQASSSSSVSRAPAQAPAEGAPSDESSGAGVVVSAVRDPVVLSMSAMVGLVGVVRTGTPFDQVTVFCASPSLTLFAP